MSEHVVFSIRLHDRRYHGISEWPPSPARLFQALVAGAARGKHIPEATQRALLWLELQPPPLIAVPHAREGQAIFSFVPNNDTDSLAGDLSRIGEIRSQKSIRPRLFASSDPLVYAWAIDGSGAHIEDLALTAEDLYQFGRGVDMAWAETAVMSEEALALLLSKYRGVVHRPGLGAGANALACPMSGSLDSLVERHQATLRRLRMEGEGRNATCFFAQPPRSRFAQVAYAGSTPSQVFELVRPGTDKAHGWRLREVVSLVERIRDVAVHTLGAALPRLAAEIQGTLIGKRPGEISVVAAAQRVRIIPLPSIGHEHADCAIRRVLVEVPDRCPISPEDVFWAFSGNTFDPATGELAPLTLIPKHDDSMRARYERASREFRSITPAALPLSAKRRRIDPGRRREEQKSASERIEEERRAVIAVHVALHHAGVRVPPVSVRVQREPFEGKGARAELFASKTRFEKERLWHVAIQFAEPVQGPLVIGDGRFLGLGVLRPDDEQDGVFAFTIEQGLDADADPVELARALRRAVMARVQHELGRGVLPPFFSGHDANGGPAKRELHPHIALHHDMRGRLLIVAPHVAAHRLASSAERKHISVLERALSGFCELRAGRAGLLSLRQIPVRLEGDEVFGEACRWLSITPYALQRHPKGASPSVAMVEEIGNQCRELGLPSPQVEVRGVTGAPGRGVQGVIQLTFPVSVAGPLILGRSRFLGGGLFVGIE